jgi:hypothetical protein
MSATVTHTSPSTTDLQAAHVERYTRPGVQLGLVVHTVYLSTWLNLFLPQHRGESVARVPVAESAAAAPDFRGGRNVQKITSPPLISLCGGVWGHGGMGRRWERGDEAQLASYWCAEPRLPRVWLTSPVDRIQSKRCCVLCWAATLKNCCNRNETGGGKGGCNYHQDPLRAVACIHRQLRGVYDGVSEADVQAASIGALASKSRAASFLAHERARETVYTSN